MSASAPVAQAVVSTTLHPVDGRITLLAAGVHAAIVIIAPTIHLGQRNSRSSGGRVDQEQDGVIQLLLLLGAFGRSQTMSRNLLSSLPDAVIAHISLARSRNAGASSRIAGATPHGLGMAGRQGSGLRPSSSMRGVRHATHG